MNIGEKIKRYRKEKGLTQKQLAEKSHIALMSIQRYERNERQPNIEILNKIADTLGIPVTKLLGTEIAIYNDSIKNIDKLIKKYPNNEASILKAVSYLIDSIDLCYINNGNNNITLATKNIDLLNELLFKLHEFLERDTVLKPSDEPIKYKEKSIYSIHEISQLLEQILINKLKMYNVKEGD